MATRPGISTQAALRLADDHQQLVFAVKLQFDTETIRLHTGAGELTIDSETYEGAGTLLSIGDIEDSADLASNGVTFSLSGMDADVLGYALTENYQNRLVTMKFGFLSGGTDHVIGSMDLYVGRMTQINIIDDPIGGSVISVQTESRLIDLRRPSNYRYTKESQNYLYPNDTALDDVASIQDIRLQWGRNSQGVGDGFDPGDSDDIPRRDR